MQKQLTGGFSPLLGLSVLAENYNLVYIQRNFLHSLINSLHSSLLITKTLIAENLSPIFLPKPKPWYYMQNPVEINVWMGNDSDPRLDNKFLLVVNKYYDRCIQSLKKQGKIEVSLTFTSVGNTQLNINIQGFFSLQVTFWYLIKLFFRERTS